MVVIPFLRGGTDSRLLGTVSRIKNTFLKNLFFALTHSSCSSTWVFERMEDAHSEKPFRMMSRFSVSSLISPSSLSSLAMISVGLISDERNENII